MTEVTSFKTQVAKALLEINAIGFVPDKPITFKSGIVSPVYVDNRKLPFHPQQWQLIFEGFQSLVQTENINFEILSGVETAGIPHSAVLAYLLKKPSVFVRKAAKDHGTKKMVEGGDVKGKNVLLLEDHVTTGGSSLKAVTSLREAGAVVTDCISITKYEFPEVEANFAAADVKLHTLTNFDEIFEQAVAMKKLDQSKVSLIQDWLQDPHGWAAKQGL